MNYSKMLSSQNCFMVFTTMIHDRLHFALSFSHSLALAQALHHRFECKMEAANGTAEGTRIGDRMIRMVVVRTKNEKFNYSSKQNGEDKLAVVGSGGAWRVRLYSPDNNKTFK